MTDVASPEIEISEKVSYGPARLKSLGFDAQGMKKNAGWTLIERGKIGGIKLVKGPTEIIAGKESFMVRKTQIDLEGKERKVEIVETKPGEGQEFSIRFCLSGETYAPEEEALIVYNPDGQINREKSVMHGTFLKEKWQIDPLPQQINLDTLLEKNIAFSSDHFSFYCEDTPNKSPKDQNDIKEIFKEAIKKF